MSVLGYEDAPHGHAEVIYDNVRVPKDNLLLGEGMQWVVPVCVSNTSLGSLALSPFDLVAAVIF